MFPHRFTHLLSLAVSSILFCGLSRVMCRDSTMIELSNNYLVDLQNYLNFELQVAFDVGYGTNYRHNLDPTDKDLQQTSYDFNIDSRLQLTFDFEILKFYRYTATIEVTVFDFMPYR